MSNLWRPISRSLTKDLYQDLVPSFVESATDEFIFTVKTDNTGTSNNDQFAVPTVSGGTYDCIIDWGDGAIEGNFTAYDDARWTHTFPSAGTYTIRILGDLRGWTFNNGGDKEKMTNISQWGALARINSKSFLNCRNMTVTATDYPKFLANATADDLQSIFYNCFSITTIPGVENWTAPNATKLVNFVRGISSFNQDISNLITSNITDVNSMIRDSGMDQDLSNGDFSGITEGTNWAEGTTMSTANYDALLNSLAGQSLQSSVSFHFGSATYSGLSTAGTAHTKLRNQYSWTITDGGASIDSDISRWIDGYDETTITDSSGAVSQWDDRSGNANHLTQATGSRQPTTGTNTINSKNVVLFDADFMGFPASFDLNGKTMFFVVDMDDADMDINSSNHKGLIANGGVSNYNNHITLGSSSGGAWYDIFLENNAGTVYQPSVTNIDNDALKAPMLISIAFDASSATIRMNQNEEVIGSGLGTINLRYVGKGYGSYSGNANILKGAIGEIIVIDRVLNSTEIENIESYLNTKWSVY